MPFIQETHDKVRILYMVGFSVLNKFFGIHSKWNKFDAILPNKFYLVDF